MDELTKHIQKNQDMLEKKQNELKEEKRKHLTSRHYHSNHHYQVRKECEAVELEMALLQYSRINDLCSLSGSVDYTYRYTKAKRTLAEVDEIIQAMEKRIEKKQQLLHRLASKQQLYISIQEEEQTKWASFIETSVRKHAEDGRKQFNSLVRN